LKLDPITEAGARSVQEKQKALLSEIIETVNDLFDGDLADQDTPVYVNNVILGKLLESEKLIQQAGLKSRVVGTANERLESINEIRAPVRRENVRNQPF